MVFTLAACSFFGRKNADDQRDETEEQLVIDLDDGEEIMQYISNMSLRDKVGQLFMIRPDQLCFSESSEYIHTSDSGVLSLTDEMILNLEDYPAGGFVLFDKNIESPLQIAAFTEDLKASCSTAPFIAADEEGGVVTRIAHARYKGFELKTYESMESIGRTGDTQKKPAHT